MMEHILIAVDESAAARKAVEYVGRIFGRRGDPRADITLFHVIEAVPGELLPRSGDADVNRVIDQAVRDWSVQAVARCQKQLERYRELLLAAGVPAAALHTKHRLDEARPEAKRVAAALAILEEARSGGYTTVVLGRRGTSNVPELFLGGVADKVSRHLSGVTVWIVD